MLKVIDREKIYVVVATITGTILIQKRTCQHNQIVSGNVSHFCLRRISSLRTPPPFNCSRGPVGPISVGAVFFEDRSRLPKIEDSRLFYPPTSRRDLRQALNRRCSGISKGVLCTFNLHLDHPDSATW